MSVNPVFHLYRCERCFACYVLLDREVFAEETRLLTNPCLACSRGKGVKVELGTVVVEKEYLDS